MRWLDDIIDAMDMNLDKLWKIVKDREAQHAGVHEVPKSQTQFGTEHNTTQRQDNVSSCFGF